VDLARAKPAVCDLMGLAIPLSLNKWHDKLVTKSIVLFREVENRKIAVPTDRTFKQLGIIRLVYKG
jgi:hypothetical protein